MLKKAGLQKPIVLVLLLSDLLLLVAGTGAGYFLDTVF